MLTTGDSFTIPQNVKLETISSLLEKHLPNRHEYFTWADNIFKLRGIPNKVESCETRTFYPKGIDVYVIIAECSCGHVIPQFLFDENWGLEEKISIF